MIAHCVDVVWLGVGEKVEEQRGVRSRVGGYLADVVEVADVGACVARVEGEQICAGCGVSRRQDAGWVVLGREFEAGGSALGKGVGADVVTQRGRLR